MRKKLFVICYLLVGALAWSGCTDTGSTFGSGSSPGVAATPVPVRADANDPVVVNAEKTLLIARDTFTLFVHLERENQASLAKVSPGFHQFAEKLRRDGIRWLRTADALKESYKHNRTEANKASLLTALATVSEALRQSQQYIKESGFTAP